MSEPLMAETAVAPARLSPVERAVRVFVRPKDAWEGLAERGQWLFPLVLWLVLLTGLHALVYDRVTVPMMENQWSEAVANGQMDPQSEAQARAMMVDSPTGRWSCGKKPCWTAT